MRNIFKVCFALFICLSLLAQTERAFAQQFKWQDVGPDNIGSRTRSLVVANDGTVYAASVGGGLWKSNNKGASWSEVQGYNKITGGDPNINRNLVASSIAIDPSDNTMYVGTGEIWFGFTTYFYSSLSDINTDIRGVLGGSGQFGQGVFVSTDNGATFSNENSTWGATFPNTEYVIADNPFLSIQKVIARNGRCLAATLKGVYFTDDKFQSKTASIENYSVLPEGFKEDQDMLMDNPIIDLEFGSDGYVYATTNKWVFISTDNGATFTQIVGSDVLPRDYTASNPNPGTKGRMEVAVSPSNPAVVYVAETSGGGILVGVWKSTDNGQTWVQVAPNSTAFDVSTGGPKGSFAPLEVAGRIGKGNQYMVLAVDPSNPDNVFIGGQDLFYYTDERGWVATSSSFFSFPGSPDYIPKDMCSIAFDPNDPKTFYIGTNNQIVRGNYQDDVVSPFKFTIACSGYNAAMLYDVSQSLNGDIFITTQNAELMQKFNSEVSRDFRTVGMNRGLNRFVQNSTMKKDLMLASGGGWLLERSVNEGENYERFYGFPEENGCNCEFKVAEGTNAGKCHEFVDTEIPQQSGYPHTPFVMMEIDTSGNNIVVDSTNKVQGLQFAFSTSNEHIWRIDNPFGDPQSIPYHWTRLSPNTNVPGEFVSAIGLYENTNLDEVKLFYATTNGRIFRVKNPMACGAGPDAPPVFNHSEITPPISTGYERRWVTSITVHPARPETLIVTQGGYTQGDVEGSRIWATFNALDANPTFFSLHDQSVLPYAPIYCALFNPDDPDSWLAIGTEFGVFAIQVSELTNAKENPVPWVESNDGSMSRVPVYNFGYQKYKTRSFTFPNATLPSTERYENPYDYIYIATGGRGLLRSDLITSLDGGEEALFKNTGNDRLIVYPNPTRNATEVKIELAKTADVTLEVYAVSGQKMKTASLPKTLAGTNSVTLDTSDLPSGLYIVRCTVANGGAKQTKSARLVVQQ